ncbi:MAG: RNA polymerase sigma factor [Cytophagaceae bacterium]|nr:RNA polymerase sigma factor [Gemmatimonadaceae bacterium]
MPIHRPFAQADDIEVIDAFRQGRSEAAARELIERHSPRLLRTVARVLGEHSGDAEDVLQEGWVRGLAAIPQYRGEAAFPTWMTRIALRCALDYLRRHNRAPLLSLDEARTVATPPIDRELTTDIEHALTRLSPHARSVVVLHDIEGWTHAEIGEELSIAVGTSKAHLFHARRKLRALLAHERPRRASPTEETA